MSAYDFGRFLGGLIELALVLGVIGVVVGLVMRSRNRPTFGPVAIVQMSPDGRYWWDGSGWQDVNLSAPAHAPRSPDGAYWWDGEAWHLVPKSQ